MAYPFDYTRERQRLTPLCPGWFTSWDVEECETCGNECQAANAVKVSPPADHLRRLLELGAVITEQLAPEQYHCDDRDVCDGCV